MSVRPRALALLASSGLVAAALAPSAGVAAGGAAPPAERSAMAGGGWTKVSTGAVGTLSEITTTRTADGVLHAVYVQDVGTADSYEHSTLSTSGKVIGHSNVLGTWGSLIANPELLATASGGLRLVFSGLQDTNSANFYSQGYGYDTVSDASGGVWTIEPHALTKSTAPYSGYGVGATTLSNGTPVTVGTINSDIRYRVGDIATTDPGVVNAAADDSAYTAPACCLYDTQLVNSGDAIWMTWYSNGTGEPNNGIFVQQVYPTAGPVLKAPGSSVGGDSLAADQAVAVVARPGGGVVLAYKLGYPTAKGIGLWQVGSSKVVKVPDSKGARYVSLSTGVSGRMWLAWTNDANDAFALRTSPQGFGLGTAQELTSPAKASELWSIAVDASLNQGTVLVNDVTSRAVFSRIVNPGLTLKAKGSARVGKPTKVTFTVTDAGDGVGGVKVKGGGDSCTTTSKGKCTLTIKAGKPGKVSVKATRNGYGFAVTDVKVKK
ncbi:hypothetical protein EUA93_06950 [Nocardioides oleivorans]|uniref:Bacterial Ig domain-containing protein n=1 Tax=Nocardioides oleivorans TaxID=273676 RepID=A0A4Q2RZ33_9ACTN|nr:hypothetical protein [Nocardioides oleivorans]RYB94106.1 hypothetical protein EUA93_06950 [Nocardioides oleivorans]